MSMLKPVLPLAAAIVLAGCAGKATYTGEVTGDGVVVHYADIAHAVFSDALLTAKALEVATDALVANPSAQTLADAKAAWVLARVPYQQSEVFRFGNAVVDDWEGQLNAWPLDEGLIDYVDASYEHELGNVGATANIIANARLTVGGSVLDVRNITPELIADLNEVAGSEANVASGYHAVEFLLWGQDLNGTDAGAGDRPWTDFSTTDCSNDNCDRRAQYLNAATDLLIEDLEWMVAQWAPAMSENYRAELLAESTEQGLRKMLFGMGSLSLGELAGERMKVALEAHSVEDEHDCFSDNTHNSHFYNNQGIANIWRGEFMTSTGEHLVGPSLAGLVALKDPAEAAKITAQFAKTELQVKTLVVSAEKQGVAFDQLIAQGNTVGNALVTQSIVSLVEQTAAIEKAAGILGITNLNPDTADHTF